MCLCHLNTLRKTTTHNFITPEFTGICTAEIDLVLGILTTPLLSLPKFCSNWILLVLYSPTWATSSLNSTQNIVSVSKTQTIVLQFDLRYFFPPLHKNNLIFSRAAVWKQNLPPDYQKEHSAHSSFRSSFTWDPPHEHLTWLETSSNSFLTTILFHQFNTGYELGLFQHHTLPLLHQWLCISSVSFSFLQISVTSPVTDTVKDILDVRDFWGEL